MSLLPPLTGSFLPTVDTTHIASMAGLVASGGKWKDRRGASANEWRDSWAEGRPWLEQVPLVAGGETAVLVRQVKCMWCDVLMNQRGTTIAKHEASSKHQKQQQQRQQQQQGVAMFQQQLQRMGDQAARKRVERMQDPGLRTQFATVYQHLRRGRPITDVPDFKHLLQFVGAPNVPSMHWKSNAGGRSMHACAIAAHIGH